MIALSLIFILAGFLLAASGYLLPIDVYFSVPDIFKLVLVFVGGIFTFAGWFILILRAQKTGAIHLLKAGKPGHHIWFYIHRDSTVQITPSIRVAEGQLYNSDLDSQIISARSYRLADHNICIVPEVVGHGIDVDYVLYVNLLESVYGLENLKYARKETIDSVLEKFGIKRYKEKEGQERVATGRDITEVEKRALFERATKSKSTNTSSTSTI